MPTMPLQLLLVIPCVVGEAIPSFNFSSPTNTIADHHRMGFTFGTNFKDMIVQRFAEKMKSSWFANIVEAATKTQAGAALYKGFVDYHDKHFPEAMAELRGFSESSGVNFSEIFIQNIMEEFSQCSAAIHLVPPKVSADHCSDLMMCAESDTSVCAVGHNEDNNKEDLGTLVLVRASFGTTIKWMAATYAGELSSGAFAFSPVAGFAYSLNWVGPRDAVCPSAGRGFVSRAALSSPSFEAARELITSTRASSGHNYQLMDTRRAAIINIEVAPRGMYAVRPIGAEPFFHANQYQTLVLPQIIGNSSAHRLARAAELPPPKTLNGILHTLGDQHDASWPIYHDVASHQKGDLADWTIATALFDLRAKKLTIYTGNPREQHVVAEAPLLESTTSPRE